MGDCRQIRDHAGLREFGRGREQSRVSGSQCRTTPEGIQRTVVFSAVPGALTTRYLETGSSPYRRWRGVRLLPAPLRDVVHASFRLRRDT